MHGDGHREFTVPAKHASVRLDVFLTAALGISRMRVQHAVEAGDVLVNDRPVRASHKLRPGDRIEVDLSAPPDESAILPEPISLTILHEDDDLIVVDKPAGMVVHPAGDISGGTLANALAHRWASPPRLVHRLDRDTSGLLVVARTAAAYDHLTDQFRRRTVRKHYLALVHGAPLAPAGAVAEPIGRDRKHRLRMVCCPEGQGRDALTLYAVRTRWPEFALLDVEIRTGRTHQIRVHCAHLGHPVVADEMYGKGRTAQVRDPGHRAALTALGRQFLHAARFSFDHPRTGALLTFESSLPADLAGLVTALDRDDPPRSDAVREGGVS